MCCRGVILNGVSELGGVGLRHQQGLPKPRRLHEVRGEGIVVHRGVEER
jgi:hypothetical protein